MIGYFVKSGDLEIGHIFSPYCFSFGDMIKEKLAGKRYSADLDLILIEYHLEGEFLKLPDEEFRVKSYRKKEQSIAVAIGVPNKFSKWSDSEKKRFIVDTTLRAIAAVKKNLSRKAGFDLDGIGQLYLDIAEYSKVY